MSKSYESRYREQMDKFYPNLWENLDFIPGLEPELAFTVLKYLLSYCHDQNIANILIGRRAIAAIPRDWVLDHIEAAAGFLYTDNEENDDWEFRRLGDIYCELGDESLLRRHIDRGFAINSPDVQAAAQDFLDLLEQPPHEN